MVIEIKDDVFRRALPPKPDWFDKELEGICQRQGKPLFRCVNGMKELKFRNGRMQPKYHHPNVQYARVRTTQYRRRNKKTGEWKFYSSRAKAAADKSRSLEPLRKMEGKSSTVVKAIPRPCWVIEWYQPPSASDRESWELHRYVEVEKWGMKTTIDALGPYPEERYHYLMDVVDERGYPVSPGSKIIDMLRKGLQEYAKDNRSLEQRIKDDEYEADKMEEAQLTRLTEGFFGFHGISAQRIRGTEISKPIIIAKE